LSQTYLSDVILAETASKVKNKSNKKKDLLACRSKLKLMSRAVHIIVAIMKS